VIRVLVAGAAGRMGQAVVAAVRGAGDMDLVAQVDPAPSAGNGVVADLGEALQAGRPDVAVDFTHAEAAAQNATRCMEAGVHVVLGTTGLPPDEIDRLRALAGSMEANCLIAPNFAVGAALMMRFAAEAARHLPKAEIIELHHDGKIDAPSGTAIRTARLMGGDVPIHSVRLPGLVAHQEVILGGLGETLTIRHDSLSRESFMPGVLMAVRAVARRPGLTVGIEPLLFEVS
jgi:4-hydroxy-tetrahydrodipicolinate reductase